MNFLFCNVCIWCMLCVGGAGDLQNVTCTVMPSSKNGWFSCNAKIKGFTVQKWGTLPNTNIFISSPLCSWLQSLVLWWSRSAETLSTGMDRCNRYSLSRTFCTCISRGGLRWTHGSPGDIQCHVWPCKFIKLHYKLDTLHKTGNMHVNITLRATFIDAMKIRQHFVLVLFVCEVWSIFIEPVFTKKVHFFQHI